MSLFRLDKNYTDTFRVLTKPRRLFSSSSSGVTGSIQVFPDSSTTMKEVSDTSTDITFNDGGLEDYRESVLRNGVTKEGLEEYLRIANSITENTRFEKKMEILRFEPSMKFTSDTLRKNTVRKVLFPYYRRKYGRAYNWAFTNYNSLNFFTTYDSEVPPGTVLMYPASGSYKYRPTGSFSFEFYVNPRHNSRAPGTYHAGTIMHMSSSYCISIVSGSSQDSEGYADKFRLLLQLSHSADIPPSDCTVGMTGVQTNPKDLIFSSSDNSLLRNHWHHCCIRWDNNTQNSTGSFMIDGSEAGTFPIAGSNLGPGGYLQKKFSGKTTRQGIQVNAGPADVLFIGNYYDGPNSIDPMGDEDFTAQFFNPKVSYQDGTENFYLPTFPAEPNHSAITEPDTFDFSHPLKAEVHDLKIYESYRTDEDIIAAVTGGFEDFNQEKRNGLIFYLPPFFTKQTNTRDILQTPFQTKRGSTDDPFNVPLSFGIGGHYINLENFTRELVSGSFPRLYGLSGSEIATSTDWVSANGHLYATGSVRKRNLTIMPCDNGLFTPRFETLGQLFSGPDLSLYVDDNYDTDLASVSLNNLLPTGSIGEGLLGQETSGSLSQQLQGPTPDDPSIPAGSILTIYNRTRDPSSNEVVFFDASNLFYGNRIDPGSYILTDSSVTGSGGKIAITLRDHSGSLYRADCLTKHATWNDVGVLMYDEGIGVVKTPLIPRFGVDQFSIDMLGQQNLYVLKLDIPADRATLNISNNPTFKQLLPTDQPADRGTDFCYITNVNLHDENLNVIGKSSFSQAIIKRDKDGFVVRVKLDF